MGNACWLLNSEGNLADPSFPCFCFCQIIFTFLCDLLVTVRNSCTYTRTWVRSFSIYVISWVCTRSMREVLGFSIPFIDTLISSRASSVSSSPWRPLNTLSLVSLWYRFIKLSRYYRWESIISFPPCICKSMPFMATLFQFNWWWIYFLSPLVSMKGDTITGSSFSYFLINKMGFKGGK